MMLLRADPTTKSISMLSFPRDLVAPIWCGEHQHLPDRINQAYALCGSSGALDTVKKLTGLPINYLMTVNFKGFLEIVDRVDGVWIDVDRRYFNRNVGTAGTNFSNIDLRPGYQRLKGRDALAYVRYRHTDSDLYRVARQQQFVKALKQQISSHFSIFKALRIVGAITHNVEIGQAGGGSLEKTVQRYALFAYGLPSGHFFQSKIGGLQGTNELYASTENVAQAVRDFETPDVEAPRNATAVAFGRKAAGVKTLPPSRISISVLNGNGVAGAASTAGVRARPARLPARRCAERGRPQRPELRLLPLEGLLRPQTAGVAGRCAEGCRSLRRCRVGTAAGVVALQGTERDADRRRRIDVPRDTRARAGRQDAQEAACVGALGSRRDQVVS